MNDLRIETDRLLIRPLERSDREALVALWADPEVTRHMGGPRDQTKVRAILEEELGEHATSPFGFWPVVERATGRVVGDCGLTEKEVDGRPELEIVYVFSPNVWGRGYATEAAGAIKNAATSDLGVQRLIALVDPDNAASARVAQKIGMVLERRVTRPGGALRDVYVYPAAIDPNES